MIPRVEEPPRLEDFFSAADVPPEGRNGTGLDGSGSNGFAPSHVVNDQIAGLLRVTAFRQREPGDGVPVSQATAAYLSYDEANLYVVFVCRDDPAKVRANIARREDIDDDDQVVLYLDTFNDGKRAYRFAVNPRGVQQDGIRTEGQDEDMSFDAVWSSEGQLTADGYVVRVAIPFRSLRFPRGSAQRWGIAVGRVIRRNNEESYWPHLTKEVKSFVPHFATLQGLADVSPGRSYQVNPYVVQARARLFDEDLLGHFTEGETRIGVDAKMVVRDAFTFDATVEPDFSQVESDDPQVTVNERFEVFFPEKRPFFLENADYFQTPENLFFTRRIVDPGAGMRLTGKRGSWAVGAVAINDRAQDQLDLDDPLYGHNAWIGALRLERQVGEESHVGLLMTDREFNTSWKYDRMISADARFRVGDNWELAGQLMQSTQREHDGERFAGWGGLVQASFGSRNLDYTGRYREFSPEFEAPLGFVQRVGFRDTKHELAYDFRPDAFVTKYGPGLEVEYLWDHATGQLLDRQIEAKFQAEIKGSSEIEISRQEVFEQFEGLRFRPHETKAQVRTAWLKWLFLDAQYVWGTAVNHDPADGLEPSLMSLTEAEAAISVLPTPWLRVGASYVETSLRTRPAAAHVLTERLLRTKLNYQFNRELSLRAIVDYGALDADTTLVDEQRERQWGVDLLVTYLLHPGTAVYVGYIDQFENLTVLRQSEEVVRTASPGLSVGRQVFVKLSYLWRF